MIQLLDVTKTGKPRLLTGSFQAGQVIMLDVSNPEKPKQSAVVSLGVGAGPHTIGLTETIVVWLSLITSLRKITLGKSTLKVITRFTSLKSEKIACSWMLVSILTLIPHFHLVLRDLMVSP